MRIAGVRTTPFSLTGPFVNTPITSLRQREVGFLKKEVLPRVIALVAATFFQAIDLIVNLSMAIGKIPLAMLRDRGIKNFESLNFSWQAILAHISKIGRCILGLTSSVIGAIHPDSINSFFCSPLELNWKYAHSDIGLNKFYDFGYFINLDRSTERKSVFTKHLENCGIDRIERLSGVFGRGDGVLINELQHFGIIRGEDLEGQLQAIFDRFEPGRYTPNQLMGHMGCMLSHMRLLESAIANSAGKEPQTLLVLEDDARFIVDSEKLLEKAKPELEANDWWDLAFLGYENRHEPRSIEGCDHIQEMVGEFFYTHSFLVRGREEGAVFKELLQGIREHLLGNSQIETVDCLFRFLLRDSSERDPNISKDLCRRRAVCLKTMIGHQAEGLSEILQLASTEKS